jgi:Tfp pilus assembly protein PilV
MEVMLVVAIMSIIGLGMASLMSGQASETRGLNQSLAKLET